jgi:hypothetical protein
MSLRRLLTKAVHEAAARLPAPSSARTRVRPSTEPAAPAPPTPPASEITLRARRSPAAAPPPEAGARPALEVVYLDKPADERLSARHEVAYTWDYATQRPELRALYEKAKDLMWNARDLPWETDVDPESELVPDAFNPIFGTEIWNKLDKKREVPRLRQHIASYMLSNFLHGEQGALLATSQIVESAASTDAKLYAAAQVFDEARHVEAYQRYLTEKVGLVYPPSVHLKTLLDTVLTDSRWDFKYLGMQILIEGVALGAFGMIRDTAREPLIKRITHDIMQDEARHVAFGVMALRGHYEGMAESELKDREDFILESSRLLRDRFLAQEVWATIGLPQAACEEAAAASPMMQMFRRLLFSKIVPNVKRLGLLTPRVRKGFEELDVIEYETWEASA